MSLSLYNKKRNFSETPEPEGAEKKHKGSLRFVVQKHDASSVHYDFRLEMDGVLKSWAVPKGPSLNPKDKRLAMMVEDHPYSYRTFEGIIPEGNYGAGVVIVWDEGTYQPKDSQSKSRKKEEEELLQQLQNGSIKFVLHGQKLKGEFALVKMKNTDNNAWMLIKKNDEYAAAEKDITEDETSALSGKTLAQVAEENDVQLNHPAVKRKATTIKKAATKPVSKKAATGKKKAPDVTEQLGDHIALAKKAGMPKDIQPMLATLVAEPFNNKDWLFEIKWDGYRAIAYINNQSVEIISRNKKSFTQKYQPVTTALQQLNINAVLDGEIVAVDGKGLADFQLLQNGQNSPVTLQYYAFDILWLDGYDITQLPLIVRKKILQQILPADNNTIKYSDHILKDGKDFFNVAIEQGLEGIMAKKGNSIYQTDRRSNDWLKIKVNKRQEVIIAGFTAPRKTRKFFGALLLGVYQNGELIYIGHTGSGFNKKSLEAIWKKLQPLIIHQSPFSHPPKTNMPATWVQPKLVCEIKFTEWTDDQHVRHPIFMGLREDKNPKQVTIEKTTDMPAATKSNQPKKATTNAKKAKATAAKTSNLQLKINDGVDQTITINKQELKVTNLDKVYWKKEGYTKMDLINYYLKMAPYILPYMLQRPQSLSRFPNGINSPHFFQKDVTGKVPDWIETFSFFSESTDETIEYLVCNSEASLVYMANLGCIEMHPWHSRISSPDQPDYCLIDLDPDNNSYDQVVEVAQVIKKLLDTVKVPSYCKTSGSTGMHICIPLGAQYTYEQSKQLAELIVTLVHKEMPAITSLERNPEKRKGKIYLDFLQNAQSQTMAAPYSLRPKPGAPASAPLHWSEVKKGISATMFTIDTIFERVQKEGDLFKPVLGKGINLTDVLTKMETHFL